MKNRIFLVDDDPYFTALLYNILKNTGYKEITCFTNAKDCINNLGRNPDLIFLDYQMEDMDGIEALRQIKAQLPDTNVVFCTGHEDLSIAVNAIEYGSYDYLLKSNVSLEIIGSILSNIKQSKSFALNY